MRLLDKIHKLFSGFNYLYICSRGYKYRKSVRRRIKTNEKIVFLVGYPQGWNSLKTVYSTLKENGLDVTLIACLTWPYANNNEAFWKSIDKDAIIVPGDNECISLKEIGADVVFRQTPYDEEYPKQYSAKNISKVSKLCYIPYGYEPSPHKHLQIEYNITFFPFLYAIYCDNSSTKAYCDRRANKTPFTKDILRFDYGYPRFDLGELEAYKNRYSTFLWLPRWSLDSTGNNGSSFFLFYEKLIEYFTDKKDKTLIIRPHPSMFNNFINQGAMSKEEVNQFKKRISLLDNIHLDETPNYLDSFNKSDVLISDFSSLLIEYFISGKPIVYWGDDKEFNTETKEMIDSTYKITDWNDLSLILDRLVQNQDNMIDQRNSIIKKFLNKNEGMTSTEKIVNSLNTF